MLSPARAAARRRSYGATACRLLAASGPAGQWSKITGLPEVTGKKRTGELQRLIKAGDVAAAHVLMDKLKNNGTADVSNFNMMLKACAASPCR